MRRRMKLLTMALSSLLRSAPFATTSSDASGSRPATMGPCRYILNFTSQQYISMTRTRCTWFFYEGECFIKSSLADLIVAAEL